MSLVQGLTFRQENPGDYRGVEELTREAFWDLYRPGCSEHLVVYQLRKSSAYIPELDLVACDGEKIVGHILYTRSYVMDNSDLKHEVTTFGPISVLPEYQKQEIGSALIERSKEIARNMGFKGIFIYGSPKYYYRFGFENAAKFNISTQDGKNFNEFMGLELIEGSLGEINGRLFTDPAFEIDQDELEAFDSTFPYKEKRYRLC